MTWFWLVVVLISCLVLGSIAEESQATVDKHSDFIDPTTDIHTIQRPKDKVSLQLVASDEFNVADRSFAKGQDRMWEAITKPDNTNEALQFYNGSKEFVTTENGNLVIRTKAVKAHYSIYYANRTIDNDEIAENVIEQKSITDFEVVKAIDANGMLEKGDLVVVEEQRYVKNYTSGMLMSWNKFCFTGGLLEMSIQLPGNEDAGGLWPAAWLMGNLARATFDRSTLHMWPWSYSKCDGKVSHLENKQEINACGDFQKQFGMKGFQGRGAPEIDIFEVMPRHSMPNVQQPIEAFMSSSLQVSPGIQETASQRRPQNGRALNSSYTWYEDVFMSNHSVWNEGFWGAMSGPVKDHTAEQQYKYIEDAISVNTQLTQSHFTKHHLYQIEWQPGSEGYINWYLDGEQILGITAKSLQEKTGAIIPEEPMYLILNTAISHRWGMPEPCPKDTCNMCWQCFDCTNPACQCTLPEGMKNCKNLPAEMKIDYIRLYQDPQDSSHTLGCSPPKHPTERFIAAHADRYADWDGGDVRIVGTIRKSNAEKYVEHKKEEQQKEVDDLKKKKDSLHNGDHSEHNDHNGEQQEGASEGKMPSLKKKFYEEEGEVIVTGISTVFRLLLIGIIIGMLVFSVVLLSMVIWKGVGKDVQDSVRRCVLGRARAGGYQNIPEMESDMSDKIIA